MSLSSHASSSLFSLSAGVLHHSYAEIRLTPGIRTVGVTSVTGFRWTR
jgi:hypothetical protein